MLFEIDPRPYQVEVERAEANLTQAEARVKRLELDYQRSLPMVASKALSPQDFDHVVSDRAEGVAAVAVAKAQRDTARLNLSFCRVVSPIKGRMGRGQIDPGNMVRADDTLLANVVTQDPIYVYFDIDERTKLRLEHWAQQGRIRADLSDIPITMSLADESDFPHHGKINFQDNQLDATTGTIRARGVFSNHDRLLTPGLFVRVRLPVGAAYQALMVADQAIGADQERKFVYVVDANNKIEHRTIVTGRARNRLRVVTKGLEPGERIVVSGLQRVRPGAEVTTTLIEMPGLGAQAQSPTAPVNSNGPEKANGPEKTGRADQAAPPIKNAAEPKSAAGKPTIK